MGDTVIVNFFNNYGTGSPASGGTPSDWIAVYDSTGANGHWSYLDGTQICPVVTIRSGTLRFTSFAPGTYTVRFLAYGSPDLDMQMAPPITITVIPATGVARPAGAPAEPPEFYCSGRTGSVASVRFSLSQSIRVSLRLYDLSGRSVAAFADRSFEAGPHVLTGDIRNLTAGCYQLVFRVGSNTVTKRITLLQ